GELAKVQPPKAKEGPEVQTYRGVQLLRVRELRRSKDKKSLAEAEKLLGEIIGTAKHPGWGRRNLDALKERGKRLAAQEKYGKAFDVFAGLVRELAKRLSDNKLREQYFECHYWMVRCYVLHARTLSVGKRDEAIKKAAQRVAELERSWENF